MTMTVWGGSIAVVLGLGCGNHPAKQADNHVGSGSAASGASIAWQFDQFVDAPQHRVAVLRSGTRAALVDGTAIATPPIDMGTSDPIVAFGNGQVVVLASAERAHGLDASGRESWSAPRHGRGTSGTTTFADAGATGTRVLALATGKPIYETTRPSQRVVYHRTDGYLFGDASTLWFVEEATGKERWRHSIDGLDHAAINARPGSVFILHPDRTFEELDYAQGSVISKGTCEGKPSREGEHKPSECAGRPEVDLGKDDVHRPMIDPSGGGDYYGFSKGSKATAIVARDVAGRIRWTTPARVEIHALKLVAHDDDAHLVAFVSGTDNDTRTLVVLDDLDGKLLFRHDLASDDRMLGFTGACWLVVNRSRVSCMDARTGAGTWNVVTSGDMVEAWPLTAGEALVADGNPLTLSRIAKDGRRVWQTDLPATHLEHPVVADHPAALWIDNTPWKLSDVMGIVTKDGITVVDLATGKLGKVH